MKFYKNLGEALQRNIENYLSNYPEAENIPAFNHFRYMPLPRPVEAAAREICDYCCGENNWYIIKSKYIENEPYIPLDYGHDYYVDKEIGLILIKRVNEYDYMCLYPAILLMEGMKDCGQY